MMSRRLALAAFATVALTLPAHAHHMMDGQLPNTLAQGLLSGLGHPVIGLDHLAFIVAVGVAIGAYGLSGLMALAFVGASMLGVMAHVAGIGVPGAELLVAASVLLVGVLLARGTALPAGAWAVLFAVAGLFHGYAYGESIYGAEQTPLVAYLAGLFLIQSVIALGVAGLTRQLLASPINARLGGAAVAGIGLAVLAGHILPG
ncbi:MAG: HupE/UreJ family protein [Pseudomonadota bacterium]